MVSDCPPAPLHPGHYEGVSGSQPRAEGGAGGVVRRFVAGGGAAGECEFDTNFDVSTFGWFSYLFVYIIRCFLRPK